MFKWAVRLAWLTGLLGVTGALLLLLGTEENKNTSYSRNEIADSIQPINKISSSAKINGNISLKQKVEDKQLPTLTTVSDKKAEKKETIEPAKSAENKKQEELHTATSKSSDKEETKDEEKLFTNEELQQLVRNIVETGDQNGVYAKCVQLHRTSANNKRTAQQVEFYLRSQGYAIAGREIITQKIKGLKLSAVTNCIRITIGSF